MAKYKLELSKPHDLFIIIITAIVAALSYVISHNVELTAGVIVGAVIAALTVVIQAQQNPPAGTAFNLKGIKYRFELSQTNSIIAIALSAVVAALSYILSNNMQLTLGVILGAVVAALTVIIQAETNPPPVTASEKKPPSNKTHF